MEIWDIYDKNRAKTGETHVRGEKLPAGAFHLVVFVAVFNTAGQMLIQQRQHDKIGWAGKWDITAGGAATSGDTSQQAAARELYEETGIAADFTHTTPHFTINTDSAFCDFYLLRQDVDIAALNVPNEEVAQVKWATKDEIFDMMANGSFVPIRDGTIHLCFDLIERRSTLKYDEE
ncbi:MAG: NUDIX domain-containing protein [Defluviitaleaceae bacterium]|nr:NUDIX domain-containing protein [Defluviitaleaceae bacterium]